MALVVALLQEDLATAEVAVVAEECPSFGLAVAAVVEIAAVACLSAGTAADIEAELVLVVAWVCLVEAVAWMSPWRAIVVVDVVSVAAAVVAVAGLDRFVEIVVDNLAKVVELAAAVVVGIAVVDNIHRSRQQDSWWQ